MINIWPYVTGSLIASTIMGALFLSDDTSNTVTERDVPVYITVTPEPERFPPDPRPPEPVPTPTDTLLPGSLDLSPAASSFLPDAGVTLAGPSATPAPAPLVTVALPSTLTPTPVATPPPTSTSSLPTFTPTPCVTHGGPGQQGGHKGECKH